MMDALPDGLVEADSSLWRRAEQIISRTSDSDEDIRELEQILADGLPLNGARMDTFGRYRCLVDLAINNDRPRIRNHLLRKDPLCTTYDAKLISKCIDDIEAVEFLLARGHSFKPSLAFSPLLPWASAATIHPGVYRHLVDAGVGLNNGAMEGMPPLLWGAKCPYWNVVKGFLDAGANPDVRDENGRTFLHGAVIGFAKTRAAHHDSEDDAMHFRRIVQCARDIGFDLDTTDPSGQTALHLAANRGYAKKVAILVENGADVTLRDGKGMTPMMLAKKAKRTDASAIFAAVAAQEAMGQVMAGAKRSIPNG